MMKRASKNKKKRSHSPVESGYSFVKNITYTVSHVLPSSIKKWFNTSSTTNVNGSTPMADPTDSSSEDEIPNTTVVIQSPPKRMRYSSPKINHLGQSELNYSSNNVEAIEQYDIIQPSTSRNHFKSGPNYISTINHTVNECSNENRERETTVIKSHSYSMKGGPSITKNRKSLFEMVDKSSSSKQADEETVIKKTNTSNDCSQPYFKPGLFTSPFYRGNITYGGAASSYLNQPNIKSSKTTMVNETSKHDNTISHSARCVMDLLEHYSSPLLEAKRISPYVTSQNKSMGNTSLPCAKSHSYKTQELHVPSIASILTLKHRSRIMDTTNAARQIIASHSSAVNYSPYPKTKPQSESSNKQTTGKLKTNLKSRVIRTKRGESTDLINDLPTPIKLPTAVLEIDQNNLPKFNFGIAVVSTSCSSNNQTAPISKTTVTLPPESKVATNSKGLSKDIQSSESDLSSDSNSYKFATPVFVTKNITLTSQVPKFTFEYPTQNVNEINSNREKEKSSPVLTIEDNTNTNKEKSNDWKCSDCWVFNKADASNCVCCSSKKPKEQNKGSNLNIINNTVCQSEVTEDGQDKCTKCKETNKCNCNTLIPITSLQSKTWRCADCWVDNAETSEKCVCCGLKNAKSSENIQKQSNVPESDWKCSDCWIKNQSNVDKCIACGGVKPNSALNSKPTNSLVTNQNLISSSFKARDNTFDNILKAQIDKWECSNCLVRNDSDKTKCACCDTEKTGVMKETKKTSFNFGMNTNTSFKFGIDPKVQVDNCNKDMDSEECLEQSSTNGKWETNNNILTKTPTFTFGLPVNNIDDKNKETLATPVSKVGEVPKLKFTFGIPKQTINVTETVKLDNDQKERVPTANKEEKLQEVPTINITQVQSQKPAIEQKNIFESNLNPQESLPKIPDSNTLEVTSIATEEKNLTFQPSIMQTATNIETNKSNTITQMGHKISSNLFSIPTSSIANAGTNTDSTLSVPVTASSSLFQKSYLDKKPTDTLFPKMGSTHSDTNLFQNPTTTNEITAPTFSASTNLFSFGNNAQNSSPGLSHTKFNFSFGNTNKSDPSPMFNPTFGMNKDSNANPNSTKFTLPTLNNIGTNSSLGGNSLGPGNLLTTGNSMMSNTLPGNNGMTAGNPLGVPDLGNNSMNPGNNLKPANSISTTTPSNGIFGGTGPKENVWSNTAAGNLFVATTNAMQRPATFTFGSSTPFNTNNTGTFGNNSSNVFIMQNQSSNLTTLFSNSPQPQTVPTIFGNSQTTTNPAHTMGVFGSTNPPTNSFNVHNPTIPSFEAQPQNSMAVPNFNFTSQQLGTVPFGFGQQQPQQFQSPVYNFGASQNAPQFNMGSAPSTTVRRVRKAVRRTTQR